MTESKPTTTTEPSRGQRALVTGASSGIGRAITQRLLGEGFEVTALGRNPEQMPSHQALSAEPVDLADLESLPSRLTDLARRYDDTAVVVGAAGAGLFGSLEEMAYDKIRQLIELNFIANAYLARAFLPGLKRRARHGEPLNHLLFIGSEAALRGRRRGAVYCASKFALRGFAQALREEASTAGVRVSLVHPGMVDTPFFDSLDFRPGERPENALAAEDVAEAVWLALNVRSNVVVDEIFLTPVQHVVRKKSQP